MSYFTKLRQNIEKDFVSLTHLLDLDPGRDFVNCILTGLDLSKLDLSGFNFSGADMRRCIWDDALVAETIFSKDSVLELEEIAKARDADQNPFLSTRMNFFSRKSRANHLLLLANTLNVDWFHPSRPDLTHMGNAENLIKALSIEYDLFHHDLASDIVEEMLLDAKDSVISWCEAKKFNDFREMGRSIFQLLCLSASPVGRRSRLLRLVSIVARLELHRMRFGLRLAGSPSEILENAAQLELVLSDSLSEETSVFSQILTHASVMLRPKDKFVKVGIAFSGKVVDVDPGGNIVISGIGRKFLLLKNLISVAWHHTPPAPGTIGIFVTRRSDQITQRGPEYVSAIFDLFFPVKLDVEDPTNVYLGASNSWAVIVTNKKKKGVLLANKGELVRQLQRLCGLRRITITTRSGDFENEVKNFINDGFQDIRDLAFNGGSVWGRLTASADLLRFVASGSSIYDDRKIRTFISMWEKVFPGADISISVGQSGFSSIGFRKFKERQAQADNSGS
ncbi:hypothetical protein [Cereibacter johrii]|uniref:hypothetical protein n=1 Tax=Cereibacter johrii TaxID=445629 RepID=UPI003CEE1572